MYEYVLKNEGQTEDDESLIRDAERLVNTRDWDRFTSEKGFSENPVIVEINGADVDVTFIDLPGIIQNSKVQRC